MLFNSINFLVFLILFLFTYFLLKGRVRVFFCLISSYIFYSFFNYKFLILIILSTITDYLAGLKISSEKNNLKRKSFLFISIFLNLLILGVFKYFNFFLDSFYNLISILNIEVKKIYVEILLPVGISFFTFQSMSYSIDIYNRKIKVEKDLLRFATFVSFFPQLVAGPIVRAKKLLPQLAVFQVFKWSNLFLGSELIIYGFFLKLCVADRLGVIIDPTYSNLMDYGGSVHLITSILFSFQIYSDFAGYSLIAIGIGRVMGFNFGINFKRPYMASSIQDFWRRWHISLSSWLKDYLYIPLGGNRFGVSKKYKNILIVMFLGGLWHGASVTFLLWGICHGVLLIIGETLKKIKYNVPNFFKQLTVFILVSILWIFFRSENLEIIKLKFLKIVSFENYFYNFSYDLFNLVIGFIMVCIVIIEDFIKEKKIKFSKSFRIFLSIFYLWLISFFGIFNGTNFIYFKF